MWFAYSLFFAVWSSVAMLITKKLLRTLDPYFLFAFLLAITVPFTAIILLIVGVPVFKAEFFTSIFIAAILDIVAALLFYKALNASEISLLSPISSFNPIFTLIFAAFLLNETPTFLKLVGVVIIVIGAYLLNISNVRAGILKPFSILLSDKGVQLFLVTNFLWGLTPIFQKRAALATNPITPVAIPLIESALIALMLFPVFLRTKKYKNFLISKSKLFIFLGAMTALGQFAALMAFSLTNLAYATAVFKLSVLFTVILGGVFLKEKNIKERFLGAAVMVLGTILLAF